MSLKKILKIVSDHGRLVITDEEGEPKAVMMSLREYEKLASQTEYHELSDRIKKLSEETERLNDQILDAQKNDFIEDPDDLSVIEEEFDELPKRSSEENLYIEPIEEGRF